MGVFLVVGGVVGVGVEAWAGTGHSGESERDEEQELGGGGPGDFAENGLSQPGEDASGQTAVGAFDAVWRDQEHVARLGCPGKVEVEMDPGDVSALQGQVVESCFKFLGSKQVFRLT